MIYMKLIKYSFCFLLITSVISISSIFAQERAVAGIIAGIAKMAPQKTDVSPTYYKTNDLQQFVKNDTTYTTITNPCKNCTIRVDLMNNNSSVAYVTTRIGDKKSFAYSSNTYENSNYHLKFKRVEITAVTTYTHYRWCMDVSCNI